MKFLGWMHRRLRNNNDVLKEFNTSGGGPCICMYGCPTPVHDTFPVIATYCAGDAPGYRSPAITTDLFAFGNSGGLLAIGTLGIAAVAIPEDGADANEDDASGNFNNATPPEKEAAAAAAVEAIAKKGEDATTEDDLMVVSAELEKVLADAGGGGTPSEAVSARASSAVGDCPLQGFLFGSPVSDAAGPRPASDGGRRASLGELFLRTRFAEEQLKAAVDGGGAKNGGEEVEAKGGKGGAVKSVKKRKAKDKKGGNGGGGGGGAPESTDVTKSKFQKILQIFHRKVYPESAILTRNLMKSRKRGAPIDICKSGGQRPNGDTRTNELIASSKLWCVKERMPSCICCMNSSPLGPDKTELNGNKSGHWIKNDADYLVLEL